MKSVLAVTVGAFAPSMVVRMLLTETDGADGAKCSEGFRDRG